MSSRDIAAWQLEQRRRSPGTGEAGASGSFTGGTCDGEGSPSLNYFTTYVFHPDYAICRSDCGLLATPTYARSIVR
jgi:hypothetical protein